MAGGGHGGVIDCMVVELGERVSRVVWILQCRYYSSKDYSEFLGQYIRYWQNTLCFCKTKSVYNYNLLGLFI